MSALLSVGLVGWLAGCSADAAPSGGGRTPGEAGKSGPSAAVGGAATAAAVGGSTASPAAGTSAGGAAGRAGEPAASGGSALDSGLPDTDCSLNGTSKKEGCACRDGETAACWTGSVADRNVGACHDGLQVCAGGEFATWGACMGEELSCGTDAGAPPPPETGCPCIPGAVVQCSEDCSVGIICSLTATKTCLPDGSWSTCREDLGVALDPPGFQCRNMLHGCFDVLTPEGTAKGQGEIYIGDCSKQFKCGKAPPPPPPPPPTEMLQ